MAQQWAAFENHKDTGPDADFYQAQVERSGQPALDVGCGTGRLLLPFLKAGPDVDGKEGQLYRTFMS